MTSQAGDKLPMAKWGAACAACAMAKAKCIRLNTEPNSKCDRCQRLLKECTEQVHRPRKKRQIKPSRTAQIEEKFNGLVNLLQASGELSSTQSSLNTLSDVAAREYSVMTHDTTSTSSTTPHHLQNSTWVIPETYNSSAVPSCICRPEPGVAPPPPDSDDVLLELFRSQLQTVFPFVIVPPSVSASDLRTDKPFLMSAIRMVASFRSLRSMSAQMCRLMSHIADHVLLRSARSLELLQGILVISAWHHYHCLAHAQMNNLLSLATSMVSDLSLNSPPGVREQARLTMARTDEPAGRTNGERRALLGVWFLTCNVSISFNRVGSIKYTPYMQECLKVLENEREYESDVGLIYLVQIQRLTERIFDPTFKDKGEEGIPSIPSAPMSAYIAAFQNEIDRLCLSLPTKLRNDSVCMTYLNTARLRLYEPPPVDITLVSSLLESMTSGHIGRNTPLDKLYQSSAALRKWFDTWLLVPASSYYQLPLSAISQLIYAMTMLGRWAQLATPRTAYEGGTPMPAGDGNSLFSAGSRMQTESLTGIRAPPRHNQDGDGKSLLGDQELIQAVAALQIQLQTQQELTINIPAILATVCTRCEQANSIFRDTSVGDGKSESNVWTLSALKVRVIRVKLERWAETVAAAATEGSYPQTPDAAKSIVPHGSGIFNDGFAQDQTQIQNLLGSAPWTSDLLDGVVPTLWFDGDLDWGTLVTNSMGNLMASTMGPGEPPQ